MPIDDDIKKPDTEAASALDELKPAKGRVVGTKQVLRAMDAGSAEKVFIAKDADAHIRDKILHCAERCGTPVVYVESMKSLGSACGIQVSAAAAAICRQ